MPLLPRWFGHDDVDALQRRVEDDLRFAALQLPQHLRDFLLERNFALAVVGAFSEHERFHHAAQRFGRKLSMRNDDRLRLLSIHAAQYASVDDGDDRPQVDGRIVPTEFAGIQRRDSAIEIQGIFAAKLVLKVSCELVQADGLVADDERDFVAAHADTVADEFGYRTQSRMND